MAKRYYIVSPEQPGQDNQIMIVADEHDQTLFELEFEKRILAKGDSLQDVILDFSESINRAELN